jgi:hypothetical protein
MYYDLNNPFHRKQFVTYVKKLLKDNKQVELTDKSTRTLRQNAYLHTLIRVLAIETGVTEKYAKEEYFKRAANPTLFVQQITDPVTGEQKETLGESSALTISDMSIAIDRFRTWASEQGIYLPEAHLAGEDDLMQFASDTDAKAYDQAVVETGRLQRYL